MEREVLGKRSYGQLSVHWRRMKASDRVQILPLLTVDDQRADVVACVARVRDTSVTLALSARKDLGEAVVVGHARHLADAGREVYVLIDDQGGQVLASAEGLEVITVEDLLLAAVQLGLLQLSGLRATYEALRPFGSGLPSWPASSLKQRYDEWRRSEGAHR